MTVGMSGSIPIFGGFEVGLFSTDGQGDARKLADFGVFFSASSSEGGHIYERGIGILRLGPVISYMPNDGRGNGVETSYSVQGGAIIGLAALFNSGNMTNIPDGSSISANSYGFGAYKTVTFSLSIGDLARAFAAFVTGDYNHKIWGVEKSNEKCGGN
jgi:hypothetical protein